jgi:DNA-binding NtrC family response regulator
MTRPCLIVLDREHSATISMRKLVIESAKFNVITSYSGREVLETFERFPAVDAIILNAAVYDVSCEKIITTLRERDPKIPIVVVRGPGGPQCPGADHSIESFDPIAVVELLHTLFPRAIASIRERDRAIAIEEDLKSADTEDHQD